jgi:hypothetical protein
VEKKGTRKPSSRKVVSPKKLSDAPTKEKKETKRRKRTKLVRIEHPTYLEMISEAIRHFRKKEGNANDRNRALYFRFIACCDREIHLG